MTSRKAPVPPEKPNTMTFQDPWFKNRSIESSDITRIVEMPLDLLDPPNPNKKRVPKPVPVVYSSPKPVTLKDQEDWNIPRCISNWANPAGFSFEEIRQAYNGRRGYDFEISDKFAKLSQVLSEAEERAREAISMRLEVKKEMEMMKEKKRKEQESEDEPKETMS